MELANRRPGGDVTKAKHSGQPWSVLDPGRRRIGSTSWKGLPSWTATIARTGGIVIVVALQALRTLKSGRFRRYSLRSPVRPSSRCSLDRLVADAPAFDRAVASSEAYIQTIVNDVAAVVDSGGGESLNPFKISILLAGRGRRGG